MVLDISKLDFVLMYVLGNRGSGKTLFTTCYAKDYSDKFPNRKIFSNYKLNLKNAFYHPYMILDYSELDNCLIILDDVYALKNIENFMMIIANYSRKANMMIILTCQYYTMVHKRTRTLSEFEVQTKVDKINQKLFIGFIDSVNKVNYQVVNNVFEKTKGIYDTTEKVKIPTDRKIIEVMEKKQWNTLDDLELNLLLYFNNSRKREKYYRQIGKKNGLL